MPLERERAAVVDDVLAWFDDHARDLPWRRPECSPWGVMVSEFMLQQTPVNRVLGPWLAWMERWPTPADLAAEPVGEAVRAWGRLGYPRRAQRLHAAAVVIAAEHGNQVPSDVEALRSLPGVGEYTAGAIASFAHGRRALVVDTNVKRVLARLDFPAASDPLAWLPDEAATAAHWAAASMELGALVCTARNPDCQACPVAEDCGWLAAGCPEPVGGGTRTQTWEGTDRQCRGRLLAALRALPAGDPGLGREELLAAARPSLADPEQPARCLASLLADGLVRESGGRFTL